MILLLLSNCVKDIWNETGNRDLSEAYLVENSSKIFKWLGGGETEWRTWSDSEENLYKWIKLLLSFEKNSLNDNDFNPEIIFERSS